MQKRRDQPENKEQERSCKRSKTISIIVQHLEKELPEIPTTLLLLVDSFGVLCWRTLTDEFLEQTCVDYFSEWGPTEDHLEMLNLSTLAKSSRIHMQCFLENFAEDWDRPKLEKIYQISKQPSKLSMVDESFYFEHFLVDMQERMFWRFYPMFAEIDCMFDEYSKDHMNGDCVSMKECDRNVHYIWRLFVFAFDLGNS